ncbi:hypothetical protein ACWCOP_06460 [Maricaulaceae bacterium MS644]
MTQTIGRELTFVELDEVTGGFGFIGAGAGAGAAFAIGAEIMGDGLQAEDWDEIAIGAASGFVGGAAGRGIVAGIRAVRGPAAASSRGANAADAIGGSFAGGMASAALGG